MFSKKCGLLGSRILVLGILLITTSCGQQQETPSPIPISGITITGKINTGVISSSVKTSAQAVAYQALSDYTVVAVSDKTGLVYFADTKTASDGSFTISNLPTGESFFLELLDNTNKLAAPITMSSSDGKPVMAIKPTANTDLGNIVYDSNKGTAVPINSPTAILDLDTTAEGKTGETLVPVGAKNFGKGNEAKFSGTYDPDKADGDKDGLPNFFDADNNGDGILDEMDGLYTREAFGLKAPDFHPYVFTNLKVDYNNRDSFKTEYKEFTVAIGLTKNTGPGIPSGKTISSVRIIDGPAWISTAKIFTPTGEAGLWKDSNYALETRVTGEAWEIHLTGLKPSSEVNSGDTLRFLITYTDGTSEEAVKMINFVFGDIPKATHYSLDKGATWIPITATNNPIASASTSEVYLKWTRPKDESGNEIFGGRYTFEYDGLGGSVPEVEILKDIGSKISEPVLYGGINLSSLSDFRVPSFGANFMIGLCIRSKGNDNSAENLFFTRSW